MKNIKNCDDCGHLMSEHLRNFNGQINCQICERSGQICY